MTCEEKELPRPKRLQWKRNGNALQRCGIKSVDVNRYGKEIKRIDTEKKRSDCDDQRWNSMESNGRKEN